MMRELMTTLTVNGREIGRRAPGHYTLLRWLREAAGLYEVKYGCGEGVCGACTVLVDGETVSSCLAPAARFEGAAVQTVSGLLRNSGRLGPGGSLGELQESFLEHGAAQCGFCTPGMLLAATELLASGEPLDEQRIREGLHGNLCRCTGYGPIVRAVQAVAESRGSEIRAEAGQ